MSKITAQEIVEFQSRLRGLSFLIDDIKITKCNSCGQGIVSDLEIKRWKKALEQLENLVKGKTTNILQEGNRNE